MNRYQYIQREIARVDGKRPTPSLSKHLKMAQSPFVFYRGSAQLFYADLQSHTIAVPEQCFSVPLTSVMGDCHSANFGFLTEEGSHGDTVIFAPNDFDDACVGYAHWDILRLLTSFHLMQRHVEGGQSGDYQLLDIDPQKPIVDLNDVFDAQSACLKRYVETCQRVIEDNNVLNEAMDTNPGGKLSKLYLKALKRSSTGDDFTSKSALAKAVKMHDDGLAFKHIPDKFTPVSKDDYKNLHQAFSPYMDDNVVDITSRHNAGTGSVNLRRYYFLVGPEKPHNEQSFSYCHIVEVKQQRTAAPLHYFTDLCPVNRLNPAHLTARSQRRMQRRPDLLLDEVRWDNSHWLVRSRHHAKVGLNPQDIAMGKKAIEGGFADFGALCGYTLALAHCRGDRRSTRFASQAATHFNTASNALIESANQYALQVIDDHRAFVGDLRNTNSSTAVK